jgi:Zn finger protein HypA/HybF involved in hydrogenase expression
MMNAKLIVKGKEFDIEILDPELQGLLSSSQKHGRWCINSDGYYPYCSECGQEPQNRVMTPYCPNCGVRMDGGK